AIRPLRWPLVDAGDVLRRRRHRDRHHHHIAAYKLAKLTMAKDKLQWLIFAVMAVVTAWTESEILWLFVTCGLVAMVAQAPPAWLKHSAPACLVVAATPEVRGQILWFFAKAGAFVFGSGLAIVPFLYGGVVQQYGWLDDKQFLDAVAVVAGRVTIPVPVLIGVGAAAGVVLFALR